MYTGNAHLQAENLAVDYEAKQANGSLSGATSAEIDLVGLRKIIWVYPTAQIYLNVTRASNPGNLTASTTDKRRFILPANQWTPIPQNKAFSSVHTALFSGSGTATVLINLGAEVTE